MVAFSGGASPQQQLAQRRASIEQSQRSVEAAQFQLAQRSQQELRAATPQSQAGYRTAVEQANEQFGIAKVQAQQQVQQALEEQTQYEQQVAAEEAAQATARDYAAMEQMAIERGKVGKGIGIGYPKEIYELNAAYKTVALSGKYFAPGSAIAYASAKAVDEATKAQAVLDTAAKEVPGVTAKSIGVDLSKLYGDNKGYFFTQPGGKPSGLNIDLTKVSEEKRQLPGGTVITPYDTYTFPSEALLPGKPAIPTPEPYSFMKPGITTVPRIPTTEKTKASAESIFLGIGAVDYTPKTSLEKSAAKTLETQKRAINWMLKERGPTSLPGTPEVKPKFDVPITKYALQTSISTGLNYQKDLEAEANWLQSYYQKRIDEGANLDEMQKDLNTDIKSASESLAKQYGEKATKKIGEFVKQYQLRQELMGIYPLTKKEAIPGESRPFFVNPLKAYKTIQYYEKNYWAPAVTGFEQAVANAPLAFQILGGPMSVLAKRRQVEEGINKNLMNKIQDLYAKGYTDTQVRLELSKGSLKTQKQIAQAINVFNAGLTQIESTPVTTGIKFGLSYAGGYAAGGALAPGGTLAAYRTPIQLAGVAFAGVAGLTEAAGIYATPGIIPQARLVGQKAGEYAPIIFGGYLGSRAGAEVQTARENARIKREFIKKIDDTEFKVETPSARAKIYREYEKIFKGTPEENTIIKSKVTDSRIYKQSFNFEGKRYQITYLETGRLKGTQDLLSGGRKVFGIIKVDGKITEVVNLAIGEEVKEGTTKLFTEAMIKQIREPKSTQLIRIGRAQPEVSYRAQEITEVIKSGKVTTKVFDVAPSRGTKLSISEGGTSLWKGKIPKEFYISSEDTGVTKAGKVYKPSRARIKEFETELALNLREQYFPEQAFKASFEKSGTVYTSLSTRVSKVTGIKITGKAAMPGTENVRDIFEIKSVEVGTIGTKKIGTIKPGYVVNLKGIPDKVPEIYKLAIKRVNLLEAPSTKIGFLGRTGEKVSSWLEILKMNKRGSLRPPELVSKEEVVWDLTPSVPLPKRLPYLEYIVEKSAVSSPKILWGETAQSSAFKFKPATSTLKAITETALLPEVSVGVKGTLLFAVPQLDFSLEKTILSPAVALNEIQVNRELQKQIPIEKSSVTQTPIISSASASAQVQVPAEVQIQIPVQQTISSLRPGLPGPAVVTLTRPITPKLPPPEELWFKKPVITSKKKKLRIGKGFEPLVRKRGKFIPTGGVSFATRAEAMAIGAEKVLGTARASFKVVPSAKPIVSTGKVITPKFPAFFRPSKKLAGTFVQRRSTRITSPGEIREISLIGAATRRGRTKFIGRTKKSRRFPL